MLLTMASRHYWNVKVGITRSKVIFSDVLIRHASLIVWWCVAFTCFLIFWSALTSVSMHKSVAFGFMERRFDFSRCWGSEVFTFPTYSAHWKQGRQHDQLTVTLMVQSRSQRSLRAWSNPTCLQMLQVSMSRTMYSSLMVEWLEVEVMCIQTFQSPAPAMVGHVEPF